jgi:tetrahydromethanopterin S-methyltransferase subunit F
MDKPTNDFISREERTFKFKLGKVIASALSGFIAGVVFASIIWVIALYIFNVLSK